MRSFEKGRLSRSAIFGLILGALGLLAGLSPAGLFLEERYGLEILFGLRGVRRPPQDAVIISIDRESAKPLGLGDDFRKWPRSVYARIIDTLYGMGAKAIVFDVVFEDARHPGDDRLLVEAVRRARNVILCSYLKTEKMAVVKRAGEPGASLQITELRLPMRPLADSAAGLAPFPLPKVPARVSQYWTFKTGAGDTPTLPVTALQLYTMDVLGEFDGLMDKVSPGKARNLAARPHLHDPLQGIQGLVSDIRGVFGREPHLGSTMREELDRTSLVQSNPERYRKISSLIKMYQSPNSPYLNFYGPPRTIPTIPCHEVLAPHDGTGPGSGGYNVKEKVVFVGHAPGTQSEQKEGFPTIFSLADGLDLAGVEIAATAFLNLLEDTALKPIGNLLHALIVFFWGLAMGMTSRLFSARLSPFLLAAAGVSYLAAAAWEFTNHAYWYPLILPLFFQTPLAFLGSLVVGYLSANRERQNIQTALQKYVPSEVAEKLAKNMAGFMQSQQVVYGICLWTDAERYTKFSEDRDPLSVADFMNRYFQVIFDPVRRHGGIIYNVLGDSALAIWTAPSTDTDLRRRACWAALEIPKAIEQAQATAEHPFPRTRTSLHAGYIAIGHVGAMDHYEYRPIGDIVNTTTRIESVNKLLGTKALASDEVVKGVEGVLRREVGSFLVVGKSAPVTLYELICAMEDAGHGSIDGCAYFARGLEAYRSRSWKDALSRFELATESFGGDPVSAFYIERCRHYGEYPPDESWDGTIKLDTK